MNEARQRIIRDFIAVIENLAHQHNPDYRINPEQLVSENPPQPELGDLAFPLFPFAAILRQSPQQLAQQAARLLSPDHRCQANGPYLNVFFDRRLICRRILQQLKKEGGNYGCSNQLAGAEVLIEFSSPNTNKPLHLGHLRNNALGESVARLLESAGATVHRVNLINDRGVHICKSMLAYQKFANGATPESSSCKGDHLVGEYYVRFNNWAATDDDAESQVQQMLQQWENDDPAVRQLWRQLNDWALSGLMATYQRCGIKFDKIYFESETYRLGREIVAQGLQRKIFQRRDDGAVYCDLSAEGLDQKVVQRSDGTSVYITQDLGTAIQRYHDYSFQQLIYVVGSEQNYHFKVLFLLLQKLGYEWANRLQHLSYGMVYLPEGKMKSREGTVVDADQLLDDLHQLASDEIIARERQTELADSVQTAENVALGALNYYLLRFNPSRDILFNPRETLSFVGNTGPYLQYVGSRICSLLTKAGRNLRLDNVVELDNHDWQPEEAEWQLVKGLAEFPASLAAAVEQLTPALLAHQVYETAKAFSRFYHDLPIITAEEEQRGFRLNLCQATLVVLQAGMKYLQVPFVAQM